ncbi:MAG TPA: choice-of-anchor D domain-containing protein [Candidatus Kapabacteria bacterium]|jgi:photosystem II stability/assembly factor-like uncharacterized protein
MRYRKLFVLLVFAFAAARPCTAQWSLLKQFPSTIWSVYFEDQISYPNVGFAGLGDGTIWRTLDHGVTWAQTTTPAIVGPAEITSFTFRDALLGWCSDRSNFSNSGAVWETTDGGATWTSEFAANPGAFISVAYCQASNILAADTWGGSNAYTSTDLGNSWIVVGPSLQNGISFSGMNGFMGNLQALSSLFTTDGGKSWSTVGSLGNTEIWSAYGIPGTNLFVAGGEKKNHFFLSTDGAATWRDLYSFGNAVSLTGCCMGIPSCLFLQSENEGFCCSIDTGNSWTNICGPENFVDSRFYSIGRQIFSGDKNGALWYLPDGLAAATIPLTLDHLSFSFSGVRCVTYDTEVHLTTVSTCPLTASLIGATILSGNAAFSLPFFPLPLELSGNDSVKVLYTPTGAARDSGKLQLEFHLGVRTFDTVLSLYGTSKSAPSYTRTNSLSIFEPFACHTTDSAIVIRNLSCDTLTVTAAAFTDSTYFHVISTPLPAAIAPGQYDTIFVSAGSATSGIFSSQLNLHMLSGGTTPIRDSVPVLLQVQQNARASVSGLNLVVLDRCITMDTAVFLEAAACDSITVFSAVASDTSIFHVDSIPLPATVPASGMARWPIHIAPAEKGIDSATITIRYSSGREIIDTTISLELNVLYDIPDRVELSQASIEMGTLNVPCTSQTETIVLSNPACANLTIDSIAWVGTEPAFTFDSIALPSVVSGQTGLDTIAIHFTPSRVGAATNELQITFELLGVVRDTIVRVTGEGVSTFLDTILSSSLQFDSLPPCRSQTLRSGLLNLFCDTISVTSAALFSGTDFSVMGMSFPAKIPPGDTLWFPIAMKPTRQGQLNDQVEISIEDGAGLFHTGTISTSGTGTANRASATFSTLSFSYPALSPCSAIDTAIVLTNTGICDVIILTDTTFSGYPGVSIIGFALPCTVMPDSSVTIPIRIVPGSDTSASTALRLSGAFLDTTVRFRYSSTTSGNALAFSPRDSIFTVKPCATATKTFWIANTGCGTISIDSIALAQAAGSTQFVIQGVPKKHSIPPGDTVFYSVTFDPSQPGDSTAVLSIISKQIPAVQQMSLVGGLTNVVPTARVALEASDGSSECFGTAKDTVSVSIFMVDGVADSSDLETVSFTLASDPNLLKLTKLVSASGWEILDTIWTPSGALAVRLRDTIAGAIAPGTPLLTEYFSIAVTDSTTGTISMSALSFNDSDRTFDACTLHSLGSPSSVAFTELDTCGTPLLRAVMEGDLAIEIISVRPNPVDANAGHAHIDLTLSVGSAGPVTLSLIDMLGRERWSTVVSCAPGVQTVPIDIPAVAGAAAFLEVRSEAGHDARKIVLTENDK